MKKLFLLLFSIMVFAFPCHCYAHDHNGVVQDAENYIVEDVSLPKKSVDKIIRYLEDAVIEMYSEYYTISEIHLEMRKIQLTEEKVAFDVGVHCEKVLKASSAHDLPYIQGLVEQVKSCYCEKWRKEAQAQVDARVKEIEEEYIGKPQGENADYRVMMSYRDFENLSLQDAKVEKGKVELFFVEDDVLLTMDEIKPESREKLSHAGMQTAQSLILSSAKEDLSPCFMNIQNMLLSVSEDDNTVIARECVKEWAWMWLSGKTSRAVIKLVLLPFM